MDHIDGLSDAAIREAAGLLEWRPRNPNPRVERLGLLGSAEEMSRWLDDGRDFNRRKHRSAWASALGDLAREAGAVGPAVSRALSRPLTAIHHECARGPEAVAGDRDPLRSALRELAQLLANTSTLRCHFCDLLAACSGPSTSAALTWERRQAFWESARLTGRDGHALSVSLLAVLVGGGWVIVADETRGSDLGSPEERQVRAEAILEPRPIEAHHVVWFAYTRAAINDLAIVREGLALFNAKWLRRAIVDPNARPRWITIPEELTERAAEYLTVPDDEDWVLVRVDLGWASIADPPAEAARLIDDVVDLAKLRAGRANNWTRLDGWWHAIDGSLARMSFHFREPRQRTEIVPHMDGVVDELLEVLALGGLARFREPDIAEVMTTLREWRSTRDQGDAGSVLGSVRVLEMLGSRTGQNSWEAYARRYWQWSDVRSRILGSLEDAVRRSIETWHSDPTRLPTERMIMLERTIVRRDLTLSKFYYIPALLNLEELEDVTQDRQASRLIRAVRRNLADRTASTAWIQEVESEWSRSTSRLARTRDAIAQRGPQTPISVRASARYADARAARALYLVTKGLLRSVSLQTEHEEFRADQSEWRVRFRGGLDLASALMPALT